MKSTFFSASAAIAAAVLAFCSTATADVEPHASGLARRHHAKVARAAEAHMLEKRAFKGKATWYGVHAGDMGACGTHLNADDYFVALNQGQYGNLNAQSSYCGKKITITNGIKTTQATILDACPKGTQCHWGALDMSRSLFSYFNDFGVGVFDITWWISGEGGDDSSSSSSNNNDDSSSSSSNNDDSSNDNAAEQAAQDKAAKQRAAAKKAAAEKKQKAAEKKKEEAAAKKAAAEKKKKAAAEKKKEAEKKAEEKVREAQNQNIAAFGEIMQQLNAMVENAVDPGSSAAAATTTASST